MKRWHAATLIIALVMALLAGVTVLFADKLRSSLFRPTANTAQPGASRSGNEEDIAVAAQDLTVPWEIAFLPDGDQLVTERSGTLKRIGRDRRTYAIEGVQHTSEGGLLGLALHPDFRDNRYLYVYLTARSGGGLINRVERYRYDNDRLSGKITIISDIPGASNHDGGRIAFGPDRLLYITTGDAGNEPLAQDKTSLAGKILRLNDDGSLPADNPFGNAVYSLGHRNPQGLAWDDRGRLWSTEHGRSGLKSGFDELNLIIKGSNYGWPAIEGGQTAPGMRPPVLHSGADETWAPASLTFAHGSLFFGGLRGQSLYQAKLGQDDRVSLSAHFQKEYGRIRAVAAGPDGTLYMTTSNTDGRGQPKPGDDKLIRLSPKLFSGA